MNFKKIPFQVRYKNSFEPYVLLKTAEMPLYSEDVLDRMSDKALFTADLYNKGYALLDGPESLYN